MSSSENLKTHLLIIGGGPGGYAAAFHAAEIGLDVTLINGEPRLGGVCLQRGCIPSKALLHVARVINETRDAGDWGIQFKPPSVDLSRLRQWKNEIIEKLASGIEQLCAARKVRHIRARATFINSQTVRLKAIEGGDTQFPDAITFEHAIIATGSRPAWPSTLQIGDPRVMDSTGALALSEIPESLLVVGGGYIGLELGTVYAALGSLVTVVELTDGLLPGADRDLVRPLQARMKRSIAAIHLKTRVEGLKATEEGIAAHLVGEGVDTEETFARVLVSVGRIPNTQDIGLENTQVKIIERGVIRSDSQMRTDDPRISAIGDVVKGPMLAHKASREAKVAVEVIAGRKAAFDNIAIPAVVFTDPELAWCGLTEAEARAQGLKIQVSRFPWAASGRAATLGRDEGLTKLVVEADSERVLGVGIVGTGAGDLISEGVLAVEMGAVVRDVADTIHPHPTLSETFAESAEAFFGQATHIVRPKK